MTTPETSGGSDSPITMVIDDHVATITISRPQVRNAIDMPTALALAEALDAVDRNDDVRAAVVTGAGGFFCAGMDLKAYNATKVRPIVPGRGAFGICERATTTPLIAAVEGKALGGGFEIALACDLIVAAEDAMFGLPEVSRGLVAAAGGVLRLPRLVPQKVALDMALTGVPITASTAAHHGLVARVVPPGHALNAAQGLAQTIARNAPMAVAVSKSLITSSAAWPENEMFDRQRPHTDRVRESRDAAEGARAFVEKRPPVWSGT
ncbi:crotonase/enoyl-CoA hydratase family protein [Gordonia rubripertincta]|uniref:Crotonase/enoyl-CoA hydratase family protein n=1 Tax=Gordonia rubripertincta TaxID=36822 RepID=A0ABT4MVP4_GORRU|nr:crotonase/enoyl-CoA hydratase family protein [Gordonia rubripertincta]MCZ4551061.1 crotonase/enoyl-CoA hydratase family protein [Gordonia rubripertincta]